MRILSKVWTGICYLALVPIVILMGLGIAGWLMSWGAWIFALIGFPFILALDTLR